MNNKKIGSFLASLRKVKGLTQQQLADIFFVSNKTVSKWECGDAIPDVEMLPPLAEFYEITIDEILAGEKRGAGKINSTETRNRQKDSQTKFICKSIVSKFDLFNLINYLLLVVATLLFFLLAFFTYLIVAICVAIVIFAVALILYIFAYKTAVGRFDTIEDETVVEKLQIQVGKKSVIFVTAFFVAALLVVVPVVGSVIVGGF